MFFFLFSSSGRCRTGGDAPQGGDEPGGAAGVSPRCALRRADCAGSTGGERAAAARRPGKPRRASLSRGIEECRAGRVPLEGKGDFARFSPSFYLLDSSWGWLRESSSVLAYRTLLGCVCLRTAWFWRCEARSSVSSR